MDEPIISYNLDDILAIDRLGKIEVNEEEHHYIDSLKHKVMISELTADLRTKLGFCYLSVCLDFHQSGRYFLSNDPGGVAAPYHLTQLGRLDTIFSPKHHLGVDHFFPAEETDPLQIASTKLLENIYSIHPVYVLIRNCPECSITIAAANDMPVPNYKQLYRQSVSSFEDFVAHFLDKTIHVTMKHKVCFSLLDFFTSSAYRRSIIKRRGDGLIDQLPIIPDKQIACLQLAALGYTDVQTANKLHLSPKTVPTYINRAQTALGVKTRTQAIARAIQLGYIVVGDKS